MNLELSMEEEGVQCAIASTAKSLEVLEVLSNSPYASVRRLVATNPNVSDELLMKLSADSDVAVKNTASLKIVAKQRSKQTVKQEPSIDLAREAEARKRLEALRNKYRK